MLIEEKVPEECKLEGDNNVLVHTHNTIIIIHLSDGLLVQSENSIHMTKNMVMLTIPMHI